MSLFKTRDLWTISGENDLFDQGCLKVADIGVNKRLNSIVTGSYNGYLRIYNPSLNNDNPELANNFKANDLICEVSFPSPIIQIEIGRFNRLI